MKRIAIASILLVASINASAAWEAMSEKDPFTGASQSSAMEVARSPGSVGEAISVGCLPHGYTSITLITMQDAPRESLSLKSVPVTLEMKIDDSPIEAVEFELYRTTGGKFAFRTPKSNDIGKVIESMAAARKLIAFRAKDDARTPTVFGVDGSRSALARVSRDCLGKSTPSESKKPKKEEED